MNCAGVTQKTGGDGPNLSDMTLPIALGTDNIVVVDWEIPHPVAAQEIRPKSFRCATAIAGVDLRKFEPVSGCASGLFPFLSTRNP